ncbi:MAG: DUF559 domain-containing protein [Acidimicrobiia bacterium]
MSDDRIAARIESGSWDRLGRGVYRLLPARDGTDLARGAVAALRGAVVSHMTAAGLHGIGVASSRAVVTVHPRTTHIFPGVRVVRSSDLLSEHSTVIDGLPVTKVARTLVDLAADLQLTQLERLVDDAIASGKTTAAELAGMHRQIGRRGKPGTSRMRQVLGGVYTVDIPPSVLEARFRRLVDGARIDDYEVEYPIPWSPMERFDFAFPSRKLAIELDGFQWHRSKKTFENDRRRDRDAVVNGWKVMRFTWSDISNSPSSVVETVRTALRQIPPG